MSNAVEYNRITRRSASSYNVRVASEKKFLPLSKLATTTRYPDPLRGARAARAKKP